MAEVVLVVGGGIAAYKAPEIVRGFKKAGHEVQVVLTSSATAFVTELSLSTVSGRPVRTTLLDAAAEGEVGHIQIADRADVVVVAPGTANLMARAAHGLADDLATCVLLATRAPVLWAPAMNTNMWQHPATQSNLATLAGRGHHFVGPDAGELACGWIGEGRMIDSAAIVEAAEAILEGRAPSLVVAEAPLPPGERGTGYSSHRADGTLPGHEPAAMSTEEVREAVTRVRRKADPTDGDVPGVRPGPWSGRTILISAGPTRAYIDPVRFVSNASTGAMGFALARVARELGATVWLVSGPVDQPTPVGVRRVDIETGGQMFEAMDEVLKTQHVDLVAMVAAVADLVPVEMVTQKMSKERALTMLGELEWRSEVDILASLAERYGRGTVFLGFAAQTSTAEDPALVEKELLTYASEKLERKACDALFVNRVGVQGLGFASSTNAGHLLIARDGEPPEVLSSGPPMPKQRLAAWIFDRLGSDDLGLLRAAPEDEGAETG